MVEVFCTKSSTCVWKRLIVEEFNSYFSIIHRSKRDTSFVKLLFLNENYRNTAASRPIFPLHPCAKFIIILHNWNVFPPIHLIILPSKRFWARSTYQKLKRVHKSSGLHRLRMRSSNPGSDKTQYRRKAFARDVCCYREWSTTLIRQVPRFRERVDISYNVFLWSSRFDVFRDRMLVQRLLSLSFLFYPRWHLRWHSLLEARGNIQGWKNVHGWKCYSIWGENFEFGIFQQSQFRINKRERWDLIQF